MKTESHNVDKKEDLESKGENLLKRLSKFSEELQDAGSLEKKIDLLVKFDKSLKDNKEFIKKICPDKLVSILRAL